MLAIGAVKTFGRGDGGVPVAGEPEVVSEVHARIIHLGCPALVGHAAADHHTDHTIRRGSGQRQGVARTGRAAMHKKTLETEMIDNGESVRRPIADQPAGPGTAVAVARAVDANRPKASSLIGLDRRRRQHARTGTAVTDDHRIESRLAVVFERDDLLVID